MKKPKKTLKDLGRIESLLGRQTSRAAKLLARRKTGDAENPVTAGYYERIAAQQAVALADLSEITHLIENLSSQVVEADAAKAAKKAAKTRAKPDVPKPDVPKPDVPKSAAKAPVRKPSAKPAAKPAPQASKAAALKPVAKPPAKRPPRRAPVKAASN